MRAAATATVTVTVTVALALALLAMVAAPAATSAGVVPGPWSLKFNLPRQCTPGSGFTQEQCTRLNRFWYSSPVCMDAIISSVSFGPRGPTTTTTAALRAAFAPYTTWVNAACDTPCAAAAKKKNLNPKKFCGNLPTSWRDGGCKGPGPLDCESIRACS